ncbi:hypothetical protein [Fulvivirga lutimaris]|uniref:hypothetical protein n=1 Tax=Fulvivirga lutimaris TaxID=1819566 RepID=UPI0012BD3C0A|nr:hypothetical protein [Fulvivirga lutimaris]MTI39415.1 hypothetical protein [Fulvivirga lutimaris]
MIEEKLAQDTVPWKYQLSASDYASKSDYKNSLIQWDLAMHTRAHHLSSRELDSIKGEYRIANAIDYIAEEAKNNQIVIINEAHHNSYHRVFTKSLLQKLYSQGYTNLGLEALGNGEYLDSALNTRKYPTLETGHYIKDPQFGAMVRDALEIGYNVFAYENINHDNPREIEQAKNIEKEILAHPNEKFLIHCGFDHVLEGNHRSWGKAMAGRLSEYTGVDPLTINQVVYSEKSKPEFNPNLLQALDMKESVVLLDKNNAPLKYTRGEGWTDLMVLHPTSEYIDNRPVWLFENGNKNVSIQLNDIEIEYPVMILAYKQGEDINDAVPVDIIERTNKTDDNKMALKEGAYNILVTNGADSFKFEIEVK